MRELLALTIAALITGLVPGPTAATTITVKADGSGDVATILEAVTAAVDGDTVLLVGDGLAFTGDGNRDIPFLGKDMVITGEGMNETIIDCGYAAGGFTFSDPVVSESILQNLTIRNGNAASGGGIYIDVPFSEAEPRSPVIRNVRIDSCVGIDGGGMHIVGPMATPLIEDCVITGCVSTGGSGLNGGGGICVVKASPQVIDCEIHDSIATFGGGGIMLLGDNIYPVGGTYSGNRIHDNVAMVDGGGIRAVFAGGDLEMTSNLVYANEADNGGGMYLYTISDAARIHSNTVADNQGSTGAGLTIDGDGAVVERMIIAYNSGDAPTAVACAGGGGFVNCSIIYNPGVDDSIGDCEGGMQNLITVDPEFCGSPGSFDYRLQSDSPATAANSLCGERIGSEDIACGDTPTRETTWGALKSRYRPTTAGREATGW